MIGKTELIRRVAKELKGTDNNISPTDLQKCREVCDAFVEAFRKALMEDGKVLWSNFMTAEVVEHGPRKRMDLNTREIVDCPPTKVISCKFSKTFRDSVNGVCSEDESDG